MVGTEQKYRKELLRIQHAQLPVNLYSIEYQQDSLFFYPFLILLLRNYTKMSDVFTSTYNLVKKVCLDRRAVRKFLNKDIPDGVLEDILVTTQVFDSLSWSSNRAPPPLRIPNPTRS